MISKLKEILREGNARLVFAASIVLFSVILSVTSGFVVLLPIGVNPFFEIERLAIIGVIVVLVSLNAAALAHNYSIQKKAAGKSSIFGAFAAFFTTSCPVCQPVLLVWLGFGGASAALSNYGIYIGLVSILLLLVSLHFSLKCNSCGVGQSGKH